MIYLVDTIPKALNDGDSIQGSYLDYNKAFDMIDHPLVMKTL